MSFQPASVLLDKNVIRRVYEFRVRVAQGRPPTFSQAEAASAYARLRALQQQLYLTLESANVLQLRPPRYAARLLAQTLVLRKGRYLRRWARRLRGFVFSREDAVVLTYGGLTEVLALTRLHKAWACASS